MIEQRMYNHQIFTLLDITKTNVLQHSVEKTKERNQQRNFETVCQLLGLRTQLFNISNVWRMEDIAVAQFKFGSFYLGDLGFKYNVWSFSFSIEFDEVYRLNDDPYGTIKNDFVYVPAIVGLDEQMPAPPHPLFYAEGVYKNIYFTPTI
jgi:hypothetical protein